MQKGPSFSSMQFKNKKNRLRILYITISPQNRTLNLTASFFLFVIITYIGAFNFTFTNKLSDEGRLLLLTL